MRNIEVKLRNVDLADVFRRSLAEHADDCGTVDQIDHVFATSHGRRLKLRIADGHGELIAYQRSDDCEPLASDYNISQTDAPEDPRRVLQSALGEAVTVRKRRRLLRHGKTRIHLDTVEGLGEFVELETVVGSAGDEAARTELDGLREALGLASAVVVGVAYVDLLRHRRQRT